MKDALERPGKSIEQVRRPRQKLRTSHIAGENMHGGTQRLQCPNAVNAAAGLFIEAGSGPRLAVRQAAAPLEHQATGAALHHPLRRLKSNRSQPAGDPVDTIGLEGDLLGRQWSEHRFEPRDKSPALAIGNLLLAGASVNFLQQVLNIVPR